MCAKKKYRHIFCSTKCKKDAQVKYNRPKIDDRLFKKIYDKYYRTVKICAFQMCENKTKRLQHLEDLMQYGFLELWFTYNRNKMECSDAYIKKAVKNAMWANIKYWFKACDKYVATDFFEKVNLD